MKNLIIILLFISYTSVYAQEDSAAKQEQFFKAMSMTDAAFSKKTSGDSILKIIERLAKQDTMLKEELYDYYNFGFSHRKRAFEWNLTSSMIIFWTVIFLVLTGVAFAGLQFYISIKRKDKASDVPLNTELEASMKGIKISSPVLGLIILVISLLFFYLYLAYVYPMQEVF